MINVVTRNNLNLIECNYNLQEIIFSITFKYNVSNTFSNIIFGLFLTYKIILYHGNLIPRIIKLYADV